MDYVDHVSEELNRCIQQYLSGKISVHAWIKYMRDNGHTESEIGNVMDCLITDYPAVIADGDPAKGRFELLEFIPAGTISLE
jgi:hypothetical protein